MGSLRALAWALCCAVGGAAAAAPSEIVWKDLSGWEVEYGRWRAEEGTLLQTEVGPARTIIWRPGKAYSDLDLTIPFKASSEGDGVKAAGVVYRAVSQEEYYYIHYDVRNSQVVWVRSAPGKEWTDARRHRWPELRAETWHTTRVVVRGDRHEVYLDGKRLFTETDGTLQAGVIGLRTGQGRIAFGTARLEGTEVSLDRPFVVLKPPFSDLCTDAGTGGYEAFPDVCRTKSGELLCVFYAGHGHVSVPNDKLPKGARICLARSTDNGKTWSKPEVVVDTPIDDRDPSITQLSDGRLVVTYMTYVPGRKPMTHEVFLVWSADGGKTWGPPQPVDSPLKGNEAVSEPIREMPDGTLLLPLYGAAEPGQKSTVCVLLSRDGGRSWPEHAMVHLEGEHLHEPSVVRLPDGRLLMVIRPRMTWCESTDGGRSWTRPQAMPVSGDAPYLLLTSRQILLCAFRHRPTKSTRLIYSTDAGKTWSEPILLDRVIGAYPSLVELPDGRILVVYYTEGAGSDIRALFLDASRAGVRVLPKEGSDTPG
ncbi:MAG TPA: DUF1080 domain-containing protein [Armatimonadetes bacterium]|nr:DUF1080 domain-containing protein [Armatimonadota bacterium]